MKTHLQTAQAKRQLTGSHDKAALSVGAGAVLRPAGTRLSDSRGVLSFVL